MNTITLGGTGSITFNVFGRGDTTCVTAIHTETVSRIWSTGPFSTMTGDAAGSAAASYNWTAGFSGDSKNAPASSGCGSEPVTIGSAQLSRITPTTRWARSNPGDFV